MKRIADLCISIVMNIVLWAYCFAYIAWELVRMKELRAGLLGAGLMAFGLIVIVMGWLLMVGYGS